MYLLNINQIHVPEDRLRPVLPEDVAALSESIEELGILQPIVVEGRSGGGLFLRAGEHRLKAVELIYANGGTITYGGTPIEQGKIPCNLFEELDAVTRLKIEFEENKRRKQMTWQEEAAAHARLAAALVATGDSLPAAIETIAKIESPDAVSSAPKARIRDSAFLGRHLSDPDVAKAKNVSEALKIVDRKQRKAEDERVGRSLSPGDSIRCIHADCLDAFLSIESASVDFVLSDPPYGVGITQFSTQNASEQEYDDSYENWCRLIPPTIQALSRILKPDAQGYLFCDYSRFNELRTELELNKFEVYPRPFIWNRAPDGRAPTPEKWPKRCYETLVYFRRGSAPIFEVRPDVLSYPSDRSSDNYHGAKKPVALANDLLERHTRVGDTVLDFCAGSGFVGRAAKLSNRRAILIEKDPAYFGLMTRLLNEEAPF